MRMNRLITLICLLFYINIVNAERVQIGDLVYELNDKDFSAVVIGHEGVSGNLMIPATVSKNGIYSVTGIRMGAFSGCADLTGVELPSSLISIGNKAFEGCSGLNALVIPDAVNKIGEKAFEGCVGIKNLVIGESLKNVGLDAFSSCSNIQLLEYNAADCVFEYKLSDNLFSEVPDTPIFSQNISAVKIGEKVKNIPAYFLIKNKTIKNIEIPNSVETIDSYAFYRCGLKELVIPSSVTTIGTKAFLDNNIATLTFTDGENNLALSSRTFGSCPVENLYLGRNLSTGSAFSEMPLKEVIIGDFVTIIRGSSFYKCKDLSRIKMGNSVKTIGSSAFSNCIALTHIDLSDKLIYIGDHAFSDCYNLKEIKLPGSVEEIGQGAFWKCENLEKIYIPQSLKSVEMSAFGMCSNLSSVHISDLESWCKIWFDDFLSNPLSEAHHLYLNGEEIINLVIPNTVNLISDNAFYGASHIENLYINKKITLSAFAFTGCSGLKNIYCNLITPLSVYYISQIFSESTFNNTTLHVPKESLDVYKKSEWKKFRKIVPIEYQEIVIESWGEPILSVGKELQLTLHPVNNEFIEIPAVWISSDASVATVDQNGLVTALKEGSAVITAATQEGLYATIEITVTSTNGVEGIVDDEERSYTVYTIDGRLVLKDGRNEDLDGLKKGLYIINGKKVIR